jgi:multisubunit Na+/H+ antiporter MnhB subunit
MYKLITILAAAIPIILFLRTIIFGKSKVLREATSEFRRQVDYLVWGFVFLIGCALVYSVGTLIHSMWK